MALGRGGVKSLEDLADLAADELMEMAGQTGQEAGLDEALAGDIIMDARRRLGWIEDEPTPPETEVEADETA